MQSNGFNTYSAFLWQTARAPFKAGHWTRKQMTQMLTKSNLFQKSDGQRMRKGQTNGKEGVAKKEASQFEVSRNRIGKTNSNEQTGLGQIALKWNANGLGYFRSNRMLPCVPSGWFIDHGREEQEETLDRSRAMSGSQDWPKQIKMVICELWKPEHVSGQKGSLENEPRGRKWRQDASWRSNGEPKRAEKQFVSGNWTSV